ncbi:TPR-like protein [Rhizoctonia solani]|uniref:TPR-like protein n=1 Tax=Rhizoctonia solani TaxID=456999 RepID=A0A8H7LZ21_9AGAM|nr:TPR-like protein [Rhizoctonia solani]
MYRKLKIQTEVDEIDKDIELLSRVLSIKPDGHADRALLLIRLGNSYDKRFDVLGQLNDLHKTIEYRNVARTLISNDSTDLPELLIDLTISLCQRFERIGKTEDLDQAVIYGSTAITLTPENHPSLTNRLINLGAAHSCRFERLGNQEDLEKAIECESRAVALTPNDHPQLPGRIANLSISYSHRFRRLGELSDLEQAIQYGTRAVASTSDDHPSLPTRLANLGASHSYRFQRVGELSSLEKAIKLGSRSVVLTPHGHPDMSRRLANLGTSYTYRFRRLGEVDDLERAIKCESLAVSTTPDNHPDLPGRLANLAASLNSRFEHLNELNDLEKAIKCGSRAVSLTSDEHPSLPGRLANLGSFYEHRFQRLNQLDDLERAIKYELRAIDMTPSGHPDLPGLLANAGASYSSRFRRLGELSDLEQAIKYESRGVNLTNNDHPELPGRLFSLGSSYRYRFERLGELGDLERAIEYQSRAINLTPDGQPDLPERLAGLCICYNQQFKRTEEPLDLKKAIEYGSRAVSLTPDGHPDLPGRLDTLGSCYIRRFKRLDELDDLEKSIDYRRRAIVLTPDDHQDLPARLNNLVVSLNYRFERLGELDDLEAAVDRGSRAVSLIPNDHPDLPALLANIGTTHSYRFGRLGELNDLEQAIKFHHEAVILTPDDHHELPGRLANLGGSYTYRFERAGDLSDLQKGIEYGSRAIALTPDGHPEMPSRLANLGVCYDYRFKQLNNLNDLEHAIECNLCAVVSTPDNHPALPDYLANLGTSYYCQFQRLGEIVDVLKAIEYESRAVALIPDGHPYLSWQHFNLAKAYLSLSQYTEDPKHQQQSLDFFRLSVRSAAGTPRDRFGNAFKWAKQASRHKFLRPLEAYQAAIDLLPQFIWLGATTAQRYQDLLMAEALAVQAASAAIGSSEPALALEWLEHARCVVWNQNLMLRSPLDKLKSVDPCLAMHLQDVADSLYSASMESRESRAQKSVSVTPEQVAQEHRSLAKKYNELLAQIRKMPGFEDFLRPSKANVLVRAARHGPVVVINCYEDRCDALVVLPQQDSVQHLPLSKFSRDKAQSTRAEMEYLLRSDPVEGGTIKRRPVSLTQDIDFGNLLSDLWYGIVKPVLDHLGYSSNVSIAALPHITWCPTGILSFLPLHAAGDYDQPESRVFNYASLHTLPLLPHFLTPAETPGQTKLPGTIKELACVKKHGQNKVNISELIDSQATKINVLDAMAKHDWEWILLTGRTLDLASINQGSFKNKGLAFLSACQTATGDDKLPDEVIHLASGMLMAGYSSVIGTMWPVADNDAAFVADKVYSQLMRNGEIGNGEAGKALHNAIAALREEIGEREFGRWVLFTHIGFLALVRPRDLAPSRLAMSTTYAVAQPQAPNLLQPPQELIRNAENLLPVLFQMLSSESQRKWITDADLYEQLVEREKKLDWITQRKRIELQDGLQKMIKTRKTLRVFISHTCANQAWQASENTAPPNFETGEGVPSWTLRIQGRLLEPEGANSEGAGASTSAPKFSTFLKAMRVEIERDQSLYSEPNHTEWHNAPQEQPVNGFNITRRGDQPLTRIRIMLHLAPSDPSLVRFKLSPQLAHLLDMTSATRPDAISAMWNYVRSRGLFDKVDRRKVRSDEGLRTIANADMFDFHHIPDIVTRHLVQQEPIILNYELKYHNIVIDVDDVALKTKLQEAYTAITQGDQPEIQNLEEKPNQRLVPQREFCKSYAANPQQFIHRWIASQSRDLDVILGQGGMAGTETPNQESTSEMRIYGGASSSDFHGCARRLGFMKAVGVYEFRMVPLDR